MIFHQMGLVSCRTRKRLIRFDRIFSELLAQTTKMAGNKRKTIKVAAAYTVFLALAACGKKEDMARSAGLPEVEVVSPVAREVFEYEILPGRVAAVDEVEIRARVAGSLDKISFIEGSEVKAGDPLFEINPREYQANLEAAKAEKERSSASLEQAESDFKRAEQLKQSNAISQEEVEIRSTQVSDAKGRVLSAKAAVASANLDLEYTQITSPIDGKISSLAVTRGNLISEGDTLTTVVRQSPVYVVFEVPERSVLRWDRVAREAGGQRFSEKVKAEVGLLSEQGFPSEAKVDFVDNAINPGTGTLRMRAILENEDRSARVGLYARVRLSLKKGQKTLLIPERAVGTDQGQRFVFLLDDDDTVVYRKVVPGQVHDGLLAITDGLSPQDRVITEGLLSLKAGIKAKPVK